jgi:hypothetical protein
MAENNSSGTREIQPDEKVTPVMVYSKESLTWGNLVTKETMLASRLLIGAAIPDYLSLFDAQNMPTQGEKLIKPQKYNNYYIPVAQIIAYHLMPPVSEPYDFDVNEPNREMREILVHVGAFHFNAHLRISTQTTIQSFLDVSKSRFVSVYDLEITHPQNPQLSPIKVNMAVVRRDGVYFST